LFSRVGRSATLRPNNSFKPNATSGVGLILALGPYELNCTHHDLISVAPLAERDC
jgi:hypothetical protein